MFEHSLYVVLLVLCVALVIAIRRRRRSAPHRMSRSWAIDRMREEHARNLYYL